MSAIRVGVAQVDFTPRPGLPLMGNFRDDYGAKGVHDPLCARAMVFRNAKGGVAALLSVDVCMMNRDNVALMRKSISSQCDVRPDNVLIAATHTHSGPAPMPLGSIPGADPAEIATFLKRAASAVPMANANVQGADVFVGYSSESRVSFNRRLACKDGQTHMNWEKLDPEFVVKPLGPIDPQVTTLFLRRYGRPAAGMVIFALHPAILAGDNWLYSADYPGYLSEAMARVYGKDFVTAFFNGCCGNVNHIDYSDSLQGRGYKMTQRVGHMLAIAAQEAMSTAVAIEGDAIAVSARKVTLKRLRISEEERARCEAVLERMRTQPAKGQVDGLPEDHYALTRLAMYKVQHEPDQVEVMAMRIGNVGIVGLPGEFFCEFGLEIKKKSLAGHTLVIELANDAIGYLPTSEAFDQGGYEPTTGTTFYECGSGERLTAAAVELLNQLF